MWKKTLLFFFKPGLLFTTWLDLNFKSSLRNDPVFHCVVIQSQYSFQIVMEIIVSSLFPYVKSPNSYSGVIYQFSLLKFHFQFLYHKLWLWCQPIHIDIDNYICGNSEFCKIPFSLAGNKQQHGLFRSAYLVEPVWYCTATCCLVQFGEETITFSLQGLLQ